ncbi:unnamed protein product, partial [Schistosoma curassoni]
MISPSAGIWFVLSHNRLLLIWSGPRIRSILRRQLLINTCIFWMMAFAVLQVSATYSRTVLTFVLKILTLVLVDNCFELQMFSSCKYAALAFPIRAFSWCVLSHRRLLLMVSGQWTLSILRRQLFINTCTLLMMVVVVLHVSAPHSRTVLTFALKTLTLVLVEGCFEFHMFFNCRNAALALPILAFTSASEPPC